MIGGGVARGARSGDREGGAYKVVGGRSSQETYTVDQETQ